MKLFLTSEVQYVAESIGHKIGAKIKQNSVFIITTIRDKPHSDLEWHYTNKKKMEENGFSFEEYDITGKSSDDLNHDLGKYDCMYVEGGNSYYLLQEAQKNNFGAYVKERVENGMIYLSTSAGSVIMGPDIEPVRRDETTPLAPDLKGTKAFNIVNFVIMPHWGNEERRSLYNNYRINHIYNEEYPYILINDSQYIEVVGDKYRIVDVRSEI